jgi:hypothetical protein
MNRRLMALLVTCGWLVMAGSMSAHHSTAMYDSQNPVTISGTVKKFVYLEVKDEKTGKVVEWEVEMMSLNHLRGYGWTSKTVKPGDSLSATGAPAKSGAPSMIANRMKLADGREIRS